MPTMIETPRMRCEDCGRSTPQVTETTAGEWLCDRCALDLWMTAPQLVTATTAICREPRPPRDARAAGMASRARERKAALLAVAFVTNRHETGGATADELPRPGWLVLADYAGVNKPSGDTIALAVKMLTKGMLV